MAETTKITKPPTPAPAATAAAPATVLETRSISRRDDTVEYERPATRRAAWREKFQEGFKTFLWVAPLTALIWIYAERAQIAPLEIRVPISVRSTSPDRVVTILSPTDRYVTLDLRAPRASLDAVRERLSTSARPVEVIIPEDIAPGFLGDISVTERIERNPLFQDWAVDVERSFPAVHIRVEKKVSRVLPIRLKPEDSGFANVTFDPPHVTIEGPQSVIERIPADQAVFTDLDRLRSYKPGTYPVTVSVIGYDQENVVKAPARVTAVVEIKPGDRETLSSILIETIVPAHLLSFEREKVSPDKHPRLLNVEVSGPPAQIARIKEGGDFQVSVQVRIQQQDLLQPTFTKRITAENYILPPDVIVVNPNRDIAFKVEPR